MRGGYCNPHPYYQLRDTHTHAYSYYQSCDTHTHSHSYYQSRGIYTRTLLLSIAWPHTHTHTPIINRVATHTHSRSYYQSCDTHTHTHSYYQSRGHTHTLLWVTLARSHQYSPEMPAMRLSTPGPPGQSIMQMKACQPALGASNQRQERVNSTAS